MDIRLPDTTLHARVEGAGAALLVMHGGLGLDHTYLRPWLDPLADDVRLVYYDHRGNGRSERPASLDGVDHATWADDADALRDRLGEDRIVLLGHSYGAFLALEYALRHPERLRGLVLVSAAAALDYVPEAIERARARATAAQMETLTEVLSAPVADDAAFREKWLRVLPVYFHRYEPAYGEAMDRDARYSARASNHAFAHCLPAYDVRPRLGEIAAPTLVLSGRHDWITPPDLGARPIIDAVPDAHGAVFEESGHFPFVEEPGAFVETVRRWLRRLSHKPGSGG